MLMSRVLSFMQIHTTHQWIYKGHFITPPNDVQNLAVILPRYPKHIPVIVLQLNDRDNKYQELKVRRKNVEDALTWLIKTAENSEPNDFL